MSELSMSYEEGVQCLTTMMRYWPQLDSMTNEAGSQWVSDFRLWEFGTAITALKLLHDELKWPPSYAEFRQAAASIERASKAEADTREVLDRTYVRPPEDLLAGMHRRRRIVTEHLRRPQSPAELLVLCQRDARAGGPDKRARQIGRYIMGQGPPPEGVTDPDYNQEPENAPSG